MLTVEEVTSEDQFRKLQPSWERFLNETGSYSPFLSHEWFWCCLKGYKKDNKIFILIIKDGASLVGIAPLWRYRDIIRGTSVHKVGFILGPDSPFTDFIIDERRRRNVLEAILLFLYSLNKKYWDIFVLDKWPVKSINYRTFQEVLNQQRRKIFISYPSLVPYISIQGDWEDFLRTRSVKFRKTHRNIINRISKLAGVEIQSASHDSKGDILKEVYHVSERSWKEKEGLAMTSRKEFIIFFEELTRLAGLRKWLNIWILKVDSIPVAMEYEIEYAGEVFALRSDFDEEYKKYSPGAYLEYQIIKYYFENGYSKYNTGPGLNTYKMHWTDKLKENVNLNICNNNFKGLKIWTLEKLVIPFLKKVRDLKESSLSKNNIRDADSSKK